MDLSQLQPVTAIEFAAKYRSKVEVYMFLTHTVKKYLPCHRTITIFFCKDIVMGRKRGKHIEVILIMITAISRDDVRTINVPHYEGLRVADIIDFAMQHSEFDKYLPDGKERRQLPREFVANVAYTVIGDQFGNWVD